MNIYVIPDKNYFTFTKGFSSGTRLVTGTKVML